MDKLKNIANKKICVIGAGLSGIHAAVLAGYQQAKVFLTEGNPNALSDDDRALLEKYNIDYEIGQHSNKIENYDLYIISPGIPKESAIYRKIIQYDKPIISEVEFASWFATDGQIVAITGTNGKSTTVRLINHLFQDTKYHAYLGGNIGIPFSKLVLETEDIIDNKIYILEISSFQLEDIINFKPDVAAILNISADHLNRYEGSIDKYLSAKLRIAENQTSENLYLYKSTDPYLKHHLPKGPELSPFDKNKYKNLVELQNDGAIRTTDGNILQVRGKHNYNNLLATLAVASRYEVSREHIIAKLQSFKGLAHRLEYVRKVDSIQFYNDSKATNIDSVIQALKSFANPIILILGGRDKELDFKQLTPYLKKNVKKVVLIGEAAQKIKRQIGGTVSTIEQKTMEDVIEYAYKLANPDDVVLLSPGCASYDMYDNYKHRGNHFKEIVNGL